MDTVRGLDKIKASKGYTLLYFIVKTVKRSSPKMLNFMKNYSDISKVSKSGNSVFLAKVKEFENMKDFIKNSLKELLDIKSTEESEEDKVARMKFVEYFDRFIKSMEGKLDEINEISRSITRVSKKCAELYGLSNSYKAEEIMKLLENFFERIKVIEHQFEAEAKKAQR